MQIEKADLVALLRSRGLNDKADWVERTLPAQVDTVENRSLLAMLGVDPATLAPGPATQP
jgi:hypothetical protein